MSESDVGAERSEQLPDANTVFGYLLRELGVDESDIASVLAKGELHLLALERLIVIEPGTYTLEEAGAMSGIEADHIRAYWRALGFPDPRPGEPIFSESDLDMIENVVPWIEDGALAPGLAVQMARVIGSSLNRIATAQIEAIEREVVRHLEESDVNESADGPDFDPELVGAAQRAAELLPMMPQLMEFVWRRHLGAAARRKVMRAAGEISIDGCVVGFADMVGFTAQTQQLPDDELAAVVDRFETIAYDVVGTHRGRIVKTIGDEVMFIADDPRDGAAIALDLAARYRDDAALSDVRVGLAVGQVLERDGDVFGPVVNLAHRIVTFAYPAAVVVSPEMRAALEDDADFRLKSIRSHYLRDIGRVPLWTLHLAGADDEQPYTRAEARRAARREFLRERRRLQNQERAELVGEGANLPVGITGEWLDQGRTVDPSTDEFAAITDALLDADLEEDLQIDLLADLEAARRLSELEEQAQQRAEAADLEAERKLVVIEHEARTKVEAVLQEAEEKARRANETASRKVKRVAEDTERKADKAEKEAKRDARRKAAKRKAERDRASSPARAKAKAKATADKAKSTAEKAKATAEKAKKTAEKARAAADKAKAKASAQAGASKAGAAKTGDKKPRS